ncbi:MAG: hypothetical protein KAT04_15165 [Methylococcales bacterium]|nr:hypothetical protein [Methylococcales bacterium]
MEQVKIGLMLPGAKSFNDLNVNPTWKAHIKTHDSVVIGYVKQVSPRNLYIECICAIVGRSLGLSIPKPLIVKVTSDNFKSIPDGQFALAFGSEDADYPSFRRYAQSEEALGKLKEYSKTIDVGVFDEWVANWDRNIGNILYDGGNSFSFIDHENAIDVSVAEDEPARANQIIDIIYTVKSEFEKFKLSRDVQTSIIPPYNELPFSILSEKTYASSYLSDEEVLSVISFLENRVQYLDTLFRKRLRLQQQEMAL